MTADKIKLGIIIFLYEMTWSQKRMDKKKIGNDYILTKINVISNEHG